MVILRLKVLALAILFFALFHHSPLAGYGEVVSATSQGPDSALDTLMEKGKEGKQGRIAGYHYYWDKGLHIDSRKRNVRLKIGEKL